MTGKFIEFGRKNTGISQINGLDDLCQGRPSEAKAKTLPQGQGKICSRGANATNFGL